jgi:hypothetical protein
MLKLIRLSLLLLLGLPLAAQAANPIQFATGTYVNTATTATASLSGVVATHQIIAVLTEYNPGSTATGVADNASGTCATGFTKIAALSGYNTQGTAEVWWCASVTSPPGTYTVTATWGAAVHGLVRIIECSGLTAVDQFGTLAPANTTPTTQTVTASSVNTNANDFVVGVAALGFTGTNPTLSDPPTSSYTTVGGLNQGWGTLYVDSDVGTKNVSATETSAATWTMTGGNLTDMAMIVVSFNGGGASTTTGPTAQWPPIRISRLNSRRHWGN